VLYGDLRSSQLQRFANSSCPVRTHTLSFVLNDLRRSDLRQITSFASYSAPRVHRSWLLALCSHLLNDNELDLLIEFELEGNGGNDFEACGRGNSNVLR
jgi:hypothetical protein